MESVPCLAGKKKMPLLLMTEEQSIENGCKMQSGKYTKCNLIDFCFPMWHRNFTKYDKSVS